MTLDDRARGRPMRDATVETAGPFETREDAFGFLAGVAITAVALYGAYRQQVRARRDGEWRS